MHTAHVNDVDKLEHKSEERAPSFWLASNVFTSACHSTKGLSVCLSLSLYRYRSVYLCVCDVENVWFLTRKRESESELECPPLVE